MRQMFPFDDVIMFMWYTVILNAFAVSTVRNTEAKAPNTALIQKAILNANIC